MTLTYKTTTGIQMDLDLKDWWFVASNGLELVGKNDSRTPRVLSPVLQLIRPFVPSPSGQVGMSLSLLPFIGVGLRSLTVPEGSIFVSLTAFGQGYEKNWLSLIERGLAMDVNTRTKGIGLSVPGENH